MPKIDMTATGITTRLKRVSQLRRLCLSLQTAKLQQEEMAKDKSKSKTSPSKTAE